MAGSSSTKNKCFTNSEQTPTESLNAKSFSSQLIFFHILFLYVPGKRVGFPILFFTVNFSAFTFDFSSFVLPQRFLALFF